jgi:hypothetical protein
LPYQGINSAFVATKEQLRGAFLSVSKSGNYQHRDLDWTNKGMAQLAVNGAPIPGFDFSKVVIQFFLGLLKGAGEMFDPNIAVAKKIHDAAQLIGPALVDTINKAKTVGKRPGERFDEDPMDLCALPEILQDVDIPMFLISMGLLPLNVFGMFGIGPPLGPIGIAYLTQFGFPDFPGYQALGTDDDKKRERCKLKLASGTDLTGPKDCE